MLVVPDSPINSVEDLLFPKAFIAEPANDTAELAIFPGAGTVIGGAIGAVAGLFTGLIGSSARKRKLQKRLQEAQMRINRTNDFYQAQAQGNWLDQQYSLNHLNTQDDVLYSARHGKNIKRPTTWQ